MTGRKAKQTHYTFDFKVKVVKEVLEQDKKYGSYTAVARKYKIARYNIVKKWVELYERDPELLRDERFSEKPTLFRVTSQPARNRLNVLLDEKGMNGSQVASLMGVHRRVIHRYVTMPEIKIDLGTLQQLCEVLDCEPNELIELGKSEAYIVVDISSGSVLYDVQSGNYTKNINQAFLFATKQEANAVKERFKRRGTQAILPAQYLRNVETLQFGKGKQNG